MSWAASPVLELLRRRGFLFATAQIYGGLRGAFDFGPLGVEVKRRVQHEWWRHSVARRGDVHGFESPILTPARALIASGHVKNFTDLLVDCRLTGQRFRADKASELRLIAGVHAGWKRYTLTINAPDRPTAKTWQKLLQTNIVPGARIRRDANSLELFVAEVIKPVVMSNTPEGQYERVGWLKLERDVPETSPANPALDALYEDKFASYMSSANNLVDSNSKDNSAKSEFVTVEYRGYANPDTNSPFLTEPRSFNLLFKTFIDPIDPIDQVIKVTQSCAGEQQHIQTKSMKTDAIVKTESESKETVRSQVDKALFGSTVYLRPETAQGVFTAFPQLVKTLNLVPPFGIAQVGKSFRNEIRTEHLLYRTFEFEQMELQYFVPPWDAPQHFQQWQQVRFQWWLHYAVNKSKWRVRPHSATELAHYARACVDVEFEFPWGWGELEGVSNRGDYDLIQHQQHSGVSMTVYDQSIEHGKLSTTITPINETLVSTDETTSQTSDEKDLPIEQRPQQSPEEKETQVIDGDNNQNDSMTPTSKYVPYVIESSAGLSRAVLAFLIDSYTEQVKPVSMTHGNSLSSRYSDNNEKGKMTSKRSSEPLPITRAYLRLHPRLAPYSAAVFPLIAHPELIRYVNTVQKLLLEAEVNSFIDTRSMTIGKKYVLADEIGTPVSVTVDFETVNDQRVTIRHRDTLEQIRIPVKEVANVVNDMIKHWK